jgi:polyhydroxyalkanoate synthesis regulator phasin
MSPKRFKENLMRYKTPYENTPNFFPREFSELTKIEGPVYRHLEQLWDEIKRLKERIEKLEETK